MRATGTSREDTCGALNTLVDVAKPMRGGDVGYTIFHAYRLLAEICDKPLGRPKISRLLGLGESSVKTLLRRLREAGLVMETSRGHKATNRGCTLASILSDTIRVKLVEHGNIEFEDENGWGRAAIIAAKPLEPPRDLVSVYRVRDKLVMEVCGGAIIGGVNRGVYTFPGVPANIASQLASLAEKAGLGTGKGLVVFLREKDLHKGFSSIVRMVYEALCR